MIIGGIMQKYGFIYITTNTINGKKYIGQTSFKRGKAKNNNYLGSGKYLKEAIKKYGTKCFTKEIIFVAQSFEDLNWAERHFIEQYDAVKSRKFYNVSPGGRASLGFTGKKHSQERNKKLSDKLKGHKVSDKVRLVTSENGKLMSGARNGRALFINIYESGGKLIHKCHGNFEKTCKEYGLPFLPLKGSYLKNGKPLFENKNPGNLKDHSVLKYAGWYAKILGTNCPSD